MRRAMVAVIAVMASVTGCSSARSPWSGPFANPADPHPVIGSFIRGPVVVGGIYDIMVPDFRNYSGTTVKVVSVRLVSPRDGIRVIGARAYPYSRTTATASIDEGDLAKGCRKDFLQRPVTDVVVAPKSVSKWYLVIALKFLKLGRSYHFGVARIGYTTGGKQGWEYYPLANAYLRTVSKHANPYVYHPDVC